MTQQSTTKPTMNTDDKLMDGEKANERIAQLELKALAGVESLRDYTGATRGPWTCVIIERKALIRTTVDDVICGVVATVNLDWAHPIQSVQQEANARLIADAPRLAADVQRLRTENERLTRERDEAARLRDEYNRQIEKDEWRKIVLYHRDHETHGPKPECSCPSCGLLRHIITIRKENYAQVSALTAHNAQLRGALEQAKTALLSGDACHALKEIRAALPREKPEDDGAPPLSDPYERVFGLKPTDDAPVTIAASKPAPLPPMELLIDEPPRDAAGQKGGQ